MDPACNKFTVFASPDGRTFQFRVMPFGLKNARSTLQRFMSQQVLVGLLEKICLVYLDIIVYSHNWSEHLHHLTMVLERLSLHGLTCAVDKCHFGITNLDYLGHSVTDHGNEASWTSLSPVPNESCKSSSGPATGSGNISRTSPLS